MRPDTPIQLPKRQTAAPAKRSRQKEIPPEAELAKLKAKYRRLKLSVFLLLLALALVMGWMIYQLIWGTLSLF